MSVLLPTIPPVNLRAAVRPSKARLYQAKLRTQRQ